MAKFTGDPMDWERVPWVECVKRMQWKQGEHGIVIGETGSGKTTLLRYLLPQRNFVVVLVTKTFDKSFDPKLWPGFTVMRDWNKSKAAKLKKVLLWPTPGKTISETVERQTEIFSRALNEIFREKGWCVCIDELQWMVDQLGQGLAMKTYQHQGRSSGITVVSGFQRPSGVPPVTYGAAKHVFVSRQVEEVDVKRLAQLAGVDADKLRAALPVIPQFHWLYLGRDSDHGGMLTKLPM